MEKHDKKILVVDDEPDILKVVTFRVKKLEYEVVTATNGQEALDLIQKEEPDLILLDIELPVMNGYEVCQRVKTNEKLKHIPIIFLSANSASKIAERAKEFNADDYLIKPFDSEELLKKIKNFI